MQQIKSDYIFRFLLAFLFVVMLNCFIGCSSMEKRKYVVCGPVVGEKVDLFEDHWTDYGPFKPDDPKMKMRRGKAGVIRFFKKDNYTKSVRIDGSFIVYVFQGNEEGVELTHPEAKLILSPEQLEKQRKYDKKTGHSYHVWLDLGEVDLPEEDISLLSVFTDTKTSEQTSSTLIRTTIAGVTRSGLNEKPSAKSEAEILREELLRKFAEEEHQKQLIPAARTSEKRFDTEDSTNSRTVNTIDLPCAYSAPSSSSAITDDDHERRLAALTEARLRNRQAWETEEANRLVQQEKPRQRHYTLDEIRYAGGPTAQVALTPPATGTAGYSTNSIVPSNTPIASDTGAGAPIGQGLLAGYPIPSAIPGQQGGSPPVLLQVPSQGHSLGQLNDPLSEFVPEGQQNLPETRVLLAPAADRSRNGSAYF